jgi:pyruvate kinase
MFTTRGPDIYLGKLKNNEITIIEGYEIIISSNSLESEGDENLLFCSYKDLCQSVKIDGEVIILDNSDRDIRAKILIVDKINNQIKIRFFDSGIIKSFATMYLPFADINIPTITEEDENLIENFVLRDGFDIIAVTFVRSEDDVNEVRDLLGPRGAYIKVIAKIDNIQAWINFDKILEASDGIMIARGKLCYELPDVKLFQAQKMMIEKAKIMAKPVITSTQMLESMKHNIRPTLAEVTDVANAVLDGSDAVMLRGETATGDYPVESLQMMTKICVEAEQCIYYKKSFEMGRSFIFTETQRVKKVLSKQEAICSIAVTLAEDLNASLIIVITDTGSSVRLLAKYRPKQIILALAMSAGVIRQLKLTRGVICLKIPSFLGCESLIHQSILFAQENSYIKVGDKIICILGEYEDTPEYANIIKITTVK